MKLKQVFSFCNYEKIEKRKTKSRFALSKESLKSTRTWRKYAMK